MGFELFEAGALRSVPRVSVRRSNQIGLNEAAIKQYSLEKTEFVQLFYDREKRRIGIKPAENPTEPGAVRLRRRVTGADIAVKAFFEIFGIPHERTVVLPAAYDQKQNMVMVDLAPKWRLLKTRGVRAKRKAKAVE